MESDRPQAATTCSRLTVLYEQVGDVPNVCLPVRGPLRPAHGPRLTVYYGGADTCIGMAEAKLSELVEFVKAHSF